MKKVKKQKIKQFLSTGFFLSVTLAVFILLLGLIYIYYPSSLKSLKLFGISHPNIQQLASNILSACSNQGGKKITCYDNSLTETAKTLSMEEAFKVTHLVQESDKDYAYCHIVGHKIASEEVKKDPKNWQDVIRRCPTNQCANGCIHGAFQEKFKVEYVPENQIDLIKSQFIHTCTTSETWEPSTVERASCYHAMGHMFVYLSKANMAKSISLCKEITTADASEEMLRYCYEGAFMQVFQSLDPDDEALVKEIKPHTSQESLIFCSTYTESLVKTACVNQSWPLYIDDLKENPPSLVKFCSPVDEENRINCYAPTLSVMPIQFNFNEDQLLDYCLKMPEDLQDICYQGVAGRMIDADQILNKKAISLCSKVPNGKSESCFVAIIEMLKQGKYLSNPERKNELCPLFPPDFQFVCWNDSPQLTN